VFDLPPHRESFFSRRSDEDRRRWLASERAKAAALAKFRFEPARLVEPASGTALALFAWLRDNLFMAITPKDTWYVSFELPSDPASFASERERNLVNFDGLIASLNRRQFQQLHFSSV
jgi:hypothetical protein